MAELADAWADEGRPACGATFPQWWEMQSEGGAAGTVHGALQAGRLATLHRQSGLMLMLPNMYKIAGELTAAVFHVAARSWRRRGCRFWRPSGCDGGAQHRFCHARLRLGAGGAGLGLVAHSVAPCTNAALYPPLRRVSHLHEVNKITALHRDEIRPLSTTTGCGPTVPGFQPGSSGDAALPRTRIPISSPAGERQPLLRGGTG